MSGLLNIKQAPGMLARLFAGPEQQGLSQQQNDEARKQALIQAGLATILASSRGGHGPLQAMALGALSGQQGGAQARQGYAQQNQLGAEQKKKQEHQARIAKLIEGGEVDTPMMRRMFVESLKAGDIDGAKSLAEVLKVVENVQGQGSQAKKPNLQDFTDESGLVWLRDPETGAMKPQVGPDGKQMKARQPSTSFGLDDQRLYSRENGLRDDYRNETKDLVGAYNFIDGALKRAKEAEAGNGPAQVGLLYSFVKAMDPASAVREGEISLVQAATPLMEQARALITKYTSNKSVIVPPGMVRQMAAYMKEMQREKEIHWQEIYNDYLHAAERAKVSPEAFRKPKSSYRNEAENPVKKDPFADLPVKKK